MKLVFTIASVLAILFSLHSQDTLIYEDFSSGEMPNGWSNITNDNHTVHPSVSDFSNAWTVVDDPFEAGNFVVGSTSYFDPVDRADRWLISPEINLGPSGNMISWFGKSHDPSYPDSYRVLLSTSSDGINDFTDTLALVSNEFPQGELRELHFHDSLANQSVRIAFVNNTFNGFLLYLDSIYVRSQDPLNIHESNPIERVKIYPNPAESIVNFDSNEKIETVTFINALGKSHAFLELNNGNQININALAKGVYYVEIKTINGDIIRKKLVKQ